MQLHNIWKQNMEAFHCLGSGFSLSLINLVVPLCIAQSPDYRVLSLDHPFFFYPQRKRTEGQCSAGCIIFCSDARPLLFHTKESDHAHVAGPSETPQPRGLGQNVDNLPSGEHCQADKGPAHACTHTHTHIWSYTCAHAYANARESTHVTYGAN